MHSYISINRQSAFTRLIIPGWSILPHYFANLFKEDNLIILNPFTCKLTNDYLDQALSNESAQLLELVDITTLHFDRVFIFSMGLQWVISEQKQLLGYPCDIASPAVSYPFSNQMIAHLKKSLKAGLKLFYRQCFNDVSAWTDWQKGYFNDHVHFNDAGVLIKWLESYGQLSVNIPNNPNISVCIDFNDPIGLKPSLDSRSNIHVIEYDGGHFPAPQGIASMLNYGYNVKTF